MSLRVYGIIMHEGTAHVPPAVPAGTRILAVRELAAVVEEGEYTARDVEPDDTARHLEVIEAVFRQGAILPLPVGTVFRSPEVLQRWMELHYVALSDALAWVEDRVGARVHVSRASEHRDGSGDESGSDLAVIAADITKGLRRNAVAIVPLRTEGITGLTLSAAYLVERPLWKEFADAVRAEGRRHDGVRMTLTGPWPPYDFVRLQFGT